MRRSGYVLWLLLAVVFALSVNTGSAAAQATYTVTVNKLGNGSGTVTSEPAGINCGATCTAELEKSSDNAVFTATPAPGSRVKAWTGCSDQGDTCLFPPGPATANITVTFELVQTLTVSFAGAGKGSVWVDGRRDCTSTCTIQRLPGETVTLTATPTVGTFAGWSGDCTGTGECELTMSAARNVTAEFDPPPPPPEPTNYLLVELAQDLGGGPSGGRVTSAPAGLDCTTYCGAGFTPGSSVTLTALPDAGYVFDGWGRACSGVNPSCTLSMSADREVAAFFRKLDTLSVVKSGGSGLVTSSPSGLDCGATCSAQFKRHDPVELTATPAPGFRFIGWSGCAVTFGSRCIQTAAGDATITANFAPGQVLSVDVAGDGTGGVYDDRSAIFCGKTCTAGYDPGTVVTLRPFNDQYTEFTGWSGACEGMELCTLTMDAAKSVTATFVAKQHRLKVLKTGPGTVAAPSGIDCGATCEWYYGKGSTVTLTATPDPGTNFNGWSGGGCSGVGTCQVTMDAAKSVTALFGPGHTLSVNVLGDGGARVTFSPGDVVCETFPCAAAYAPGTTVTISATYAPGIYPESGGGFAINGREGVCANPCKVTLDQDLQAFAITHLRHWLTVNKAGTGTGTVELDESEFWFGRLLACGAECQFHLNNLFVAPLSAVPDAGSKFTGWSGAECVASEDPTLCGIVLEADTAVTATFEKLPVTDPGDGGDPGTGGGGTGTTPTGGGTGTTPTGSPTGTPSTTGTTPAKPKVRVSGKRRGKTVQLTLRFTGASVRGSRVTVRLLSGRKLVARGSGRARSARLALKLRAKKTVRKGRYRVEVTVGKTKLKTVTLRLR